jgi:hypothetical protein
MTYMALNTNYYQGRVQVDSNYDMYRCDPFRTLAEAGILIPNQPIDESCFLFGCVNDQLSVTRFLKIERLPDNHWNITDRYYKPPFNNYVPIINGVNISPRADKYSDAATMNRIGMNATTSDVPYNSPIIEMKTKYFVFYVMVEFRMVTNTSTDADGRVRFTLGSSYRMEYDKFISTHSNDIGVSLIVTSMYVVPCYGTANRRANFSDSLDILSTRGNLPIKCPDDLLDDTIPVAHMLYYKTPLLYQIYFNCGWGRALQQGYQQFYASPNLLYSAIYVLPNCNPLFWKIATTSQSTNTDLFLITYIDNITDLTLAYHSYRATGFYYFGNSDDATSYDLDNIDPNNPPERGATGTDGKVDGVKGADGDGTGLTTDPDKMYDTGFDGNTNIDPNTYTDSTPLSRPTLSPVDVFNRSFAMNSVQLRALADFLWNADDSKMEEIIKGLELFGENPLNGLIDCRLYPFSLSTFSTSEQDIVIGRVNTEIQGRKLLNNAIYTLDLGKCSFTKHFKNYLDYSPYTTGRLFLPYCGMVPIDTAEFMGHEISAKLIIDVITGVCCCCIYCDEILVITANGICGCEISMTGTDSAAYASAMVGQFANAIVQTAGGVAGIAGGAVLAHTGASLINRATDTTALNNGRQSDYNLGVSNIKMGAVAIGGGAVSVANGIGGFWNMQHTPTQYAQRGSSSPSCETWLPQYPYFIIDRPITNIPNGYGHNVGFACIETGPLSNFSGFTICSNVDTSGFAQATEAERNELKMLLEAGVFL